MAKKKDFKPSVKQYKALMYLGAIPMAEEVDWVWKPTLDDEGRPMYDTETTELGYGGAAWGWKIVGENWQVMTPRGWKSWKDLCVWDSISWADGLPQRIIWMTPWMVLPKWRVSFSDWTHTDVAGGHLWTAWKSRESVRKWWKRFFGEESAEVVETKELKNWLKNSNWNRGVPLIPVNKEVFFDQSNAKKTMVDPYLLWVLLWDWSLTIDSTISWHCSGEDMESYKEIFGHDEINYHSLRVEKTDQTKYRISVVWARGMGLRAWLKKHWLIGTYSDTKFIPEEYKYSSIEKRYELVRGLLDTDGNKKKDGYSSYYYTTSEKLANDAAFVLRSLGAVVTITDRIGKYKKDWIVIECKRCYTLHIKHRDPDSLFKLERKKMGLEPKEINKRITSVEKLAEDIRGRCITVSNPNWLYITDDFIVTHNSYLWCQRIYMVCRKYAGSRWFIAREEIKKLKESTLLTFLGVLSEYWEKDNVTYKYNNISGRVIFDNGSEVFLVWLKNEPSDPMYTRFGSMEFTWWFIDEANECPFDGYEILKTRIRFKLEQYCSSCAGDMDIEDQIGEEKVENPTPTSQDDLYIERNVYRCPHCWTKSYGLVPKILATFNPHRGWVMMSFYTPWADWELNNSVQFIQALAFDNPYLPKAYISSLKRLKDKVMKQRLLYGNFNYDDTPWRLYEYDDILALFDRPTKTQELSDKYKSDPDYKVEVDTLGKTHRTEYNYRIVCDPARHGRDLAVISLWNWLSLEEMYVYHYSSMTELESRIKTLWDIYWIWPLETLVDDDWVGCLVPGTEVMCVDGWKKVEELKAWDIVFSKDKEGKVIHDEIVRVAKKEWIGILDNWDLSFSRGQYTPIKTRKEYEFKCKPFEDIARNPAIILDNDFNWDGYDEDLIIPEQSITMPQWGKKIIKPERSIKLKDFSAFLWWFCSEGNLDRYNNRNYINISQSNKSPFNDNISSILDRCGFKWSRTESKAGEYKYVFADKWLCDWIDTNCYIESDRKIARYKKTPQIIKDATKDVIMEYLIAYNEWDWHIEKKTGNRIYSTSSTVMRDDLLELVYKSWWYWRCYLHVEEGSKSEVYWREITRNRDVWRVAEFKKTTIGYRDGKEYTERIGTVYDIRLKGDIKLYPIRFTTGRMKYKMFWTHNGWLVDALKCRGFINRASAIQRKTESDPLKRLNYHTIRDQCYFEIANHINKMSISTEKVYIFGRSVGMEFDKKKGKWATLTSYQVKKRIIEELDGGIRCYSRDRYR